MMLYGESNHFFKGKHSMSVAVLSPSFQDKCPRADRPVPPKQNRLKGAHLEKRVGQGFLIVLLLLTSLVLLVPVGQAQTPAKKKAGQAPSQTVQSPVPEASSTTPPPNQGIPLPQVADRAEDLDQLLQGISNQLTSTTGLLPSESAAKAQDEEISDRLQRVNLLLDAKPNTLELREEDLYWRRLSQQYATQRRLLRDRAATLEDQIRLLDEQKLQWQSTWDQFHDTSGIEAVINRIRQKLDAIRVTRQWANEQLGQVLTFQNQVSQQDMQISDVLTRLEAAQARLRGHLLERDSHPLWEARELRKTDQPMIMLFYRSFDRELTNAAGYLRATTVRMFVILFLFVLGLIAAFKLKRYVSDPTRPGVSREAVEIFSRPISVALLVAVLGVTGQIAYVPNDLSIVVYLLCLILALRLLPPLLEPGFHPFLFTLAAFNLLEGVRVLIPFPPVLKRELSAIAVLAAIVIFVWLGRPNRLRQIKMSGRSLKALVVGFHVAVFLLAGSFAANIFGYVSLSLVLRVGTLVGAFLAAAFYSAARILLLILVIAVRSDRGRSLTEGRWEIVERWGERILALGAFLLWLRSLLLLFTIHESVMGVVNKALQFPIGFGKISFTLGRTLSVFLILVLGFALAKFLPFVLEKTVLLSLPLKPGLPYAISKFTYYILLVLIIFAAMADAGVELNKFTVVTGAIGVGLGFGMQNIVNNFVSGLILLFERPIRVGDTVDIGGMVGMVSRIGARSSTVHTFQNAEVIVPNSHLISNQVINWTLSSSWRRVDVPVSVAYGTDPERVLKLLLEVAKSNPGVMINPQPMAFFLGFGESAMNFELRFWSARQETWFQLQSDVGIAVAKALREAGIKIPFPQRDLHVRSIDASFKETLSGTVVANDSSVQAEKSQPTPLHSPGPAHPGRNPQEE